MAFLDLDIYFVNTIAAFLQSVKDDQTNLVINDMFGGQSANFRAAVVQYLGSLEISTDLRDRESDDTRVLYILPSFTLADLPFPQISIYLGNEDSQDFMLGSETGGDTLPVVVDGVTVGWDVEQGYWAGVNYRADIVCGTKEETIWLSRLCQRAILDKILELDGMGVKEPRISLADLKLEQEQFPTMVFARGLMFVAKSLNTWNLRIPATVDYETGTNTAL